MLSFYLLMGVLFIVVGLLFWKKGIMWLRQGVMLRPKKEGYRKYMGILDISMGVSLLLVTGISIQLGMDAPRWYLYVMLPIYLGLSFYGEKKYRKEEKEEEKK